MKSKNFSTKIPLSLPSTRKWISGSGLGGSQQEVVQQQQEAPAPHVPVEDPDTLVSTSYARGIDLISEGPIAGLVYASGQIITNPAHMKMAMYFDDTPVQNHDGTLNIRGIGFNLALGTQTQPPMYGFTQAMDMVAGGEQIKFSFPVSKAISNPDAAAVEVAVRINSLVTQNKENGDLHGGTVQYKIECILNGDEAHGTFQLGTITVTGKATSPYINSTYHLLPHSGPDAEDSWVIRVSRLTADSKTINVSNDTFFEFLNIHTRGLYSYPNCAMVGIEVDARGYQSIPVRGYDVKLLKVQVPSNYFPNTRKYTRDPITGDDTGVEQIWDGTFYLHWTDNPAWCYLDLLRNNRYGLGDYIDPASIDIWSLYEISQYCDEIIDDGFGGEEPRFTCNVYIQSPEQAYKVMSDFASVFRGINYYAQGTIIPVQDRPKDSWVQFTNANVSEGIFSYSGTGQKARHTVCIVRWIDPDDNYKPKYEYVEDWDGIQKYGYRDTQVTAFACTSRGQAHRLGKWTLATELHETDTVIFRTGILGGILRPGDIFDILDNNRSGTSQGGRILAVSPDGTTVRLDRNVTLHTGVNTISVVKPQPFVVDPSDIADSSEIASSRYPNLQTHTITTAFVGDTFSTNEVTVDPALDDSVVDNSIFVVETPAVVPQQFRTVSIQEVEGGLFEITGAEYIPSKFDASETDIVLEEPVITDIEPNFGKPPSPVDVTIKQSSAVIAGVLVLKLVVSWNPPPDYAVENYVVQYRRNTDPFQTLTVTSNTYAELQYTLAGTYDFDVSAKGKYGFASDSVRVSFTVDNVSPISLYSITGLELIGANSVGQGNDTNFIGKDAKFQWNLNSPTSSPEELGTETNTGVGSGTQDPYFQDFEVTIWDIAANPAMQVYRELVTAPHFEYTQEKNRESIGAPSIGRNQFQIRVVGRTKFGESTPASILTVQNPAPQPPSMVNISSSFRSIWLEWINTNDIDLDAVNVYENTVNNLTTSNLIGTLSAPANTLLRGALATGTALFYWLSSVDTFGTESAKVGPFSTIPGSVVPADITDFSIRVTKLFTNTIVLDQDLWYDTQKYVAGVLTPDSTSIAWNDHTLVYKGVLYPIAQGSTSSKYVYWDGASASYTTSNTNPTLTDNQFMIATNVNGIHDLAWNAVANQVIGSAYIQDLAVGNAKISDLSVDKLTSGTINSQSIVVSGGLAGLIRSQNYVAGSTGWMIAGDGSAEFNNVIVRGTLDAATLYNNYNIVNKVYPANKIRGTVVRHSAIGTWDCAFGGALTTFVNKGGTWNGSAIVGGTAAVLNVDPFSNNSYDRFIGVGVSDAMYNAILPGVGLSDYSDRRLGTDQTLTFQIYFMGTVQAGHDLYVGYRIYPYDWMQVFDSAYGTSGGPHGAVVGEQSNSTYPWILSPDSLYTHNLSGPAPLIGTIDLAIPANYVLEFAVFPLDAAYNGSSTGDVLTKPNLLVLTNNP